MENLPQKKEKLLLEAILEKNSKLEIIKTFSSLTLLKIVSEKMPTIGSLKRIHGTEKIENAVGVLLEDLNSSFQQELNQNELNELIAEITSGMNQNLSFEGVYLAFKNLKYSTSFGKLTLNKVLKAVDSHLIEVIEQNQLINDNRHLAIKENPNEMREAEKQRNARQMMDIQFEIENKLKKQWK